jgi:hypothetical protein
LLVMPIAGLAYIVLVMGKQGVRAAIAGCRRRPVLWLPFAAAVLLVAAGLTTQWGLLPSFGRPAAQPAAQPAVRPAIQRPAAQAAPAQAAPAQAAPDQASEQVRTAVRLTPVSAHAYDPLDTSGDPRDENDDVAGYAIDQSPATSWQSHYYLGNPVFGGLKAGSGLIVDMGREVRLASVTVTFGSAPGADVSIKVGNDGAPAVSALASFTTMATADGIGGQHTFKATRAVQGRYVLIWFTRLPPVSPGKYQAQISNVTVRGWRLASPATP